MALVTRLIDTGISLMGSFAIQSPMLLLSRRCARRSELELLSLAADACPDLHYYTDTSHYVSYPNGEHIFSEYVLCKSNTSLVFMLI
jgi:hypothetical protein